MVRTPDFHSGNSGSSPDSVTSLHKLDGIKWKEFFYNKEDDVGLNPTIPTLVHDDGIEDRKGELETTAHYFSESYVSTVTVIWG